MKNTDREVMAAAKPYIRGTLAFIIKLRYGSMWDVKQCYQLADQFIAQLESDLR